MLKKILTGSTFFNPHKDKINHTPEKAIHTLGVEFHTILY